MAIALFVPPRYAFQDDTGGPASGWLVYTYEPGTTTAKVTYKDRDGAEANTNPIVLDARGEAQIFLDGLTKIVLKNAAGTTKWTEDNVAGSGHGVQTGYLTKNVAGAGDVDLTPAEYANSVIEFTGLLTGNINVTVADSLEGYRWILKNSTTGAYTLTFSTTSGTGVAVTQSTTFEVYSDTANIVTFSAGFGAIGFEAYASAAQTFTGLANTVVSCPNETFDSHGWYNTTTSRFTPQLAGKYLAVGGVAFVKGAAGERTILKINKNDGATTSKALGDMVSVGTEQIQLSGAAIFSLNGTSDYLEVQVYVSATDDTNQGGANSNVFFGATYIGT